MAKKPKKKTASAAVGDGNSSLDASSGIFNTNTTAEQFIQSLPNFDPAFSKNEAGILSYFARMGMTPENTKQYTDRGAEGLNELLSIANRGAATQQESRVGNEAPATSSPNPTPPGGGAAPPGNAQAAAQGGDGKGGKPREKPWKRATAGYAQKLVAAVSGQAPTGGLPGGTLESVEYRDSPGGGIEVRINMRKSDLKKRGGEADGGQATGTAPAPEPSPSQPQEESQPRTPRQPISFEQQVADAQQAYVDRTGRPAPWHVGAVEAVRRYGPGTASAIGAGIAGTGAVAGTAAALRYALGGSAPAPQQQQQVDPAERQRRREAYNRFLDPNYQPPAAQPQPQAMPQQAPAEPNPAGTPDPNSTTLMLQRMLKSREYA